jgi:hypothetical protein
MRIDRKVEAALNATGKPWRAERGSRHIKLFVDDHLIGILPQDGKVRESENWAGKNLLAQIRRAGRGQFH